MGLQCRPQPTKEQAGRGRIEATAVGVRTVFGRLGGVDRLIVLVQPLSETRLDRLGELVRWAVGCFHRDDLYEGPPARQGVARPLGACRRHRAGRKLLL